MNVTPGCIARIVRGDFPENENKLVHVEHASSTPRFWECTPLQPIAAWSGFGENDAIMVPAGTPTEIDDAILRPLYDGDAEDETLTFAGRPNAAERDNSRRHESA